MVDLCMRPASRAGSLTGAEPSTGRRVLFDRRDVRDARGSSIGRSYAGRSPRAAGFLRDRLPFTAFLPGKELARGRVLDARGISTSRST
ncbi:MAG: hypothetical protein U0166_18870 [Acidobacteriota bacterium]